MTVAQEALKSGTSAIVELYTLDCSAVGQGIFYFTNQTNPVASAGSPQNELLFTNDFVSPGNDSAIAYISSHNIQTANAIANPVNGATNASKFSDDSYASSTSSHYVYNDVQTALTLGVPYTYSVYVKAAETTRIQVSFVDSAAGGDVTFDISSGTVGTAAPGTSATITSVGGGWYRCAVTVTFTGDGWVRGQVRRLDSSWNASYVGTAGNGCYIFGAQVNIGSTAATYVANADTVNPGSAGGLINHAIVFNGVTYAPIPVTGTGWTKTLNGAAPRPTITIDNTSRILQAAMIAAGDLVGCTLTRQRVFWKYFDAVNFPGGVNPDADPSAILSTDTYLIDSKTTHNNKQVAFELCWALDIPGRKLPSKMVLRDFGFPGAGLNR